MVAAATGNPRATLLILKALPHQTRHLCHRGPDPRILWHHLMAGLWWAGLSTRAFPPQLPSCWYPKPDLALVEIYAPVLKLFRSLSPQHLEGGSHLLYLQIFPCPQCRVWCLVESLGPWDPRALGLLMIPIIFTIASVALTQTFKTTETVSSLAQQILTLDSTCVCVLTFITFHPGLVWLPRGT